VSPAVFFLGRRKNGLGARVGLGANERGRGPLHWIEKRARWPVYARRPVGEPTGLRAPVSRRGTAEAGRAEPGGDRIAGGFFDMGDGTERLGLSVWNGTAWVDSGQYDTQILNVNDTATGDFQGAVGWVGTSGVAVCVYADNQTGTLDWARWNGTNWSIQSGVAIAGKGNTESVFIESFGGQDVLMLMLSDSNSDLYSATYDGTSWTVLNFGAALETTLSSIDTAPFGLAIE
jgi:hypothetical protein